MKATAGVVVVGAGNAALCAALSARESGADVLVLERAPYGERGGNSAFTAGAMRFAYSGREEILELVPDLSEHLVARTDFGRRPPHPRPGRRQDQLGEHDHRRAVRGVPGHLRHHVHLRRPAHLPKRRGDRRRRGRDPRAVRVRRACRRPVLLQLPRRLRPHQRLGLRPHRRPASRRPGHARLSPSHQPSGADRAATAWRPCGVASRTSPVRFFTLTSLVRRLQAAAGGAAASWRQRRGGSGALPPAPAAP